MHCDNIQNAMKNQTLYPPMLSMLMFIALDDLLAEFSAIPMMKGLANNKMSITHKASYLVLSKPIGDLRIIAVYRCGN